MHTLYTFPFACCLAVHMVLLQHEVPVQLERVDRGDARKIAGDDYATVNPKRKVPALRLPDGELLTEIVGVMHFLDQRHVTRTDVERRRLLEWLSFLATELHQSVLGPAFDPPTPEPAITDAVERLLPPILAHLEATLSQRQTLLGGPIPSVADAYLLWALTLLHHRWPQAVATPGLTAFRRHMRSQPFVQTALKLESATMAA